MQRGICWEFRETKDFHVMVVETGVISPGIKYCLCIFAVLARTEVAEVMSSLIQLGQAGLIWTNQSFNFVSFIIFTCLQFWFDKVFLSKQTH